jgi:hypothetical protein
MVSGAMRATLPCTNLALHPMLHQGVADLRATFADEKHELNVSTFQMCILLLFNGPSTLSYQEIKDTTNIQPEDQLRRHLISLCTKKHRILHKTSKGKHITGSTGVVACDSLFVTFVFVTFVTRVIYTLSYCRRRRVHIQC